MFKLRYIFISILLFFYILPVNSQTIEGLKDIVSFQQEKISRIEDNLKKLVGLIEEQSNFKKDDANLKSIEKQINVVNDKLRLIENKIKNITNFTYDLEFALKRVERHLQLSSIKTEGFLIWSQICFKAGPFGPSLLTKGNGRSRAFKLANLAL